MSLIPTDTYGEAFWLVWNEARDAPRVMHHSYEAAVREAQRLSRSSPGETFFVLAATDAFVKDDIRRTRLEAQMPF